MTISECIARLEGLVKSNAYDDEQLVAWLYALDCRIYNEIISWRELRSRHPRLTGLRPYSASEDMDTDLLVDEPYTDMYIHYLRAQMAQNGGDITRYQNSMSAFNAAYHDFAAWYNRTHISKRANMIRL